ncbi:MAG TPA: CusA/CzcA family heavy metal efflux RND transporter [Cytophagaceae bacterium]
MIDALIRFSVNNKLVVFIFVLGLIGSGIYSVTQLPLDAVPDITNNQVQVITTAPTLAAQEVEQYITYPVESSLQTIQDVVEIRSVSRFGLSVVTVVFEDDVDILDARQLINERLSMAQQMMPKGMPAPELGPITTGLSEIYQYVIRPKSGYEGRYSNMELRTIQDWIVKRQLFGTPGVAEVSSFGGDLKQYEVAIDPQRMRNLEITIADIIQALEANNENTGGAYIDKLPNAYFIRGIGLLNNLEDIKKVVVKNVNGLPVRIRDVAEVRAGRAVRYGAMTYDAEGETVGGLVLMLKGANSNQVIKDIKVKIEQINKSLPEGLYIEPFLDRSELVDKTISTVTKNLVEGGLIVIFVLVLLLGNLRAGLIVASVIPLAMLFAFSMMHLFDVSANLMSLGAIDFGLIVDGAVIIVEAIVSRLHSKPNLLKNELQEEVIDASIKIRKSAAFGEIIILIVYLPILALVGVEGKMFRPMAETVIFAISGALLLSLTYVPMMSALLLKNIPQKKTWSDRIMEWVYRFYRPVLERALRHKLPIVIASIVLFLVSLIFFMRMGGEFIPTLDEGDFALEVRLTPGSSLAQTLETTLKASEILLKEYPEVERVIGKVGTAEIPTDPMPIEATDLMVLLKDKDEWTSASSREELAEKMAKSLEVLSGVEFGFQQPIQMRFNELMTGVRQDVAIKIFGEDLNELTLTANKVVNIVNKVEGVGDIFVEKLTGLPQITVEYNREKLAQYGVNINTVNTIIRTAFAGEMAGVVYEGEKRFDLVVRLPEKQRQTIEDVRALYVPLPTGSFIPITELATIDYKEGPMQISREEAKRRITIGVNVRNRDVESFIDEVQSRLAKNIKLSPGYFIRYGGQFQNLVEAKKRLAIAVPAALFLIIILLYFTFNSFTYALLVFSAVPLAAVGGVFALLLRDMSFSISAGVGFIALFGVAVLNGIVLISYFNRLKQEGVTDIKTRIIMGTKERLRPVLLTASVASLGFLPMALSGSEGAEVQKPLATVVIGGLVTATILTLIVLPVLYHMLEGRLQKPTIFTKVISIALVIGLWGASITAEAQNTGGAMVGMEEAVNRAIDAHPAVGSAKHNLSQQKALAGTFSDLPKTSIDFAYGKTNSFANDNILSVNQSFNLPGYYINNYNYLNQRAKSAETTMQIKINEIKRDTRLQYNLLASEMERLVLLEYLDSLYSKFERASELRFETGEAAFIEKVAANVRKMELSNRIANQSENIKLHKSILASLMGIKDSFNIISDSIYSHFGLVADTSELLPENPDLKYYKEQIVVRSLERKLQRTSLFPEFNVGFTSQTLKGFHNVTGTEQFASGGHRFNYFGAGAAVPLWFRADVARIKAATLGVKVAEKNYEAQKLQTSNLYNQLKAQYRINQRTIKYYREKALHQSDLLIEFAVKGYRYGETSYIELLQNIDQAVQIKLGYIDAIKNLNETIIQLNYLNSL